MRWLGEKWHHLMDWYGDYQSRYYAYYEGRYLSLAFLPLVIIAFFVFFFVLFALYG